jgi:hypothetical protein
MEYCSASALEQAVAARKVSRRIRREIMANEVAP